MRRGYSLIEGLVSSLLIGMAVAGGLSLWLYGTRMVSGSRNLSIAATIARQQVEEAKVFGYQNLPKGSFDASRRRAVWTGVVLWNNGRKNRWTAGAAELFDSDGRSTNSTSKARFSAQLEIVDTNVLPSAGGSGYDTGLNGRRSVRSIVRLVPENQVLFNAATDVVRGGL